MGTWTKPTKVKLLSGDNPQIPKGDGDEPVQAYIEAMPGWKRSVGERIDRVISDTVPGVHKKVRWNQPFYGVDADTVFISFRCFTHDVQLGFHNASALDPLPPTSSKHPEVRYLDVHDDDELDERQLAAWVEQGSRAAGERL